MNTYGPNDSKTIAIKQAVEAREQIDATHVDKADAWDVMAVKNDEIARLKLALQDISEGRGMFGLDNGEDLAWAMGHAAKAIGVDR